MTANPAGTSPQDYAVELGRRLRDARQRTGVSLRDIEDRSGGVWKAVVLGSYERGDRAVSVPRLCALAAWYGVSVHDLLPAPDPDADRALVRAHARAQAFTEAVAAVVAAAAEPRKDTTT